MALADRGDLAVRHARSLLEHLAVGGAVGGGGDHPALAWRRAGLMAITGPPHGPRLVLPAALAAAADGALMALKAIAPEAARLPGNGAVLLGERARILDLHAGGPISANGSCRLVKALDGWIALNLARSDDWDLVHALFGSPATGWPQILALAAMKQRLELVERGRMLGMAIALDDPAAPGAAPFVMTQLGAEKKPKGAPLVIDLSALWAGPLAASLLSLCGARVVKVESRSRPDGARSGSPVFFDLLNGGKESVALDFSKLEDLRRLRRLIGAADIVIESARPRALAQLGIRAEDFARSGGVWISITAHGREGAAAEWVGFGDDGAVAGGLASAMHAGWGTRIFAGDAIADPLSGITAALAAWASWRSGGGRIVSLALAQVTAHAIALYHADAAELRQWQQAAHADRASLYPLRTASQPAQTLGEDNALLARFAVDQERPKARRLTRRSVAPA